MITLLRAALGALLFRVRGGALGEYIKEISTTVARLLWAVPSGAYVWWLTSDIIAAVVFAVLSFAGLVVSGWGSWMDLKRMPDTFNEVLDKLLVHVLKQGTYTYEFVALTLRGVLVSCPGVALGLFGYGYWYTLAGGLMAVLYEIGWRIPSTRKLLARGPEIGEALYGAWLWAALGWSIH